MRKGHTVLLLQNHQSGADTIGFMETIARYYGGHSKSPAWEIAWMSGHPANIFLLVVMFTACYPRYQIYSTKRVQAGVPGVGEAEARAQTARSLSTLATHARERSMMVGLYPEGGRTDNGALLPGDPRCTKIGDILNEACPGKVWVLPTFVNGATSILPVRRQADEMEQLFRNIRPGRVDVTIGEPVMWHNLEPNGFELDPIVARPDIPNAQCARRVFLHEACMRLMAQLAPPCQRGPWG